MRIGPLILAAIVLTSGCAPKKPVDSGPSPAARRSARMSAAARADLERRVARLELSLMEKEAQVDELQSQLEEARQEVVRSMAKLQTLATRAEAASGIAEAEVALQSLKGGGAESGPEAAQGAKLLKEAAAEFDQENYGGALYLANETKSLAAAGRGRLAADERGADRPGEKPFALPIPLRAVGGGNVREGPTVSSPLAFSVEPGDALTGYSYVDEWIRITDGSGRGGWIFRKLVTRD
jgi:TolA-binding protein